jgi:hypothetical protein
MVQNYLGEHHNSTFYLSLRSLEYANDTVTLKLKVETSKLVVISDPVIETMAQDLSFVLTKELRGKSVHLSYDSVATEFSTVSGSISVYKPAVDPTSSIFSPVVGSLALSLAVTAGSMVFLYIKRHLLSESLKCAVAILSLSYVAYVLETALAMLLPFSQAHCTLQLLLSWIAISIVIG